MITIHRKPGLFTRRLTSLVVAACFMAGAAQAQTSAPQKPPVSTRPSLTTQTFGDWTVRCQQVENTGAGSRVCEVVILIQLKGQQNPIAKVAIGHPKSGAGLFASAVLPTNISLPSSVQLTGANTASTLNLPWASCVGGGCFARAEIPNATLKAWRGTSKPLKLTFRDAAKQEIGLPISTRGLAQALDALGKEAK